MMSLPDFPLNPDRVVIESPFNSATSPEIRIAGDLRYAEGGTGLPLLILCHGFTAHKDWGHFRTSAAGSPGWALRRRSSISRTTAWAGVERFNELEKFSRNTIGKELEDIRALLRERRRGFRRGAYRSFEDRHHRPLAGGGVAILSASREPCISGVAAWSTVATFHRYTPHQRESWSARDFSP